MALPEQLLLSDLLRRRVRCDQGLDHGAGLLAWMHPPVHRLLGWVCKPSSFGSRREVWRLDQLRGLSELEVLVQGDPAATEQATVERLPTLIDAALIGSGGRLLGTIADAAVDLRSGRILHYLASRSDPRLPGGSRWRLSPDRIVDQQPGQVVTALDSLDDLPLARASVRQEFLRRSRRWRDQFQQAGDRIEERVEGWLEDPPWPERSVERPWRDLDDTGPQPGEGDPWDSWNEGDRRNEADESDSPSPPRRPRRRFEDEGPSGGGPGDPWV
ncbi:MAG: RNA methyltransferase [Prochlorococcaceae cyanobacterium]